MKQLTALILALLSLSVQAQGVLIVRANITGSGFDPNDAPVWDSTPAPVFFESTSDSYPLAVSDSDFDLLTVANETGCTLPTGITINNATDPPQIDYDGMGTAGTTSGCVFSVDDGTASPVNSSAFPIVINADVSGLIYHEDFSTGGFGSGMSNFRWSASGSSVTVVQNTDRDGNPNVYMARFRYLSWSGGGSVNDKKWAEKRFHTAPSGEIAYGYPVFCESFWLFVPTNFLHDNVDGGSSNNKLFMTWMDDYAGSGDGSTVGMEYRPEGSGSYWYTKNSSGDGGSLGGDTAAASGFIVVPDNQGEWMQIAGRFTVETSPGAHDGKIEIWRRWYGEAWVKTHNVTGRTIKLPDTGDEGSLGFSGGYLLGFDNSAYANDTDWYVDDIYFGTTLASVAPTISE